MAGLAPLARAKLVACRLLHRSPPRRSSSSPLRAGRCAALHLHRDRAPRRLPHAGARRGLNICAGPVAVSPRVRDGPRDNANAPRLPMSPDPTTGVVSPAPCSGQGRSSASKSGRHPRCAVDSPDPRDPEKQGGIRILRLYEVSVLHSQQWLSAAPTTGHPVSASPPMCASVRPGLSPGAFRSLTAPSHRDESIVDVDTRVSWRTGEPNVEFDVSNHGFPEHGR